MRVFSQHSRRVAVHIIKRECLAIACANAVFIMLISHFRLLVLLILIVSVQWIRSARTRLNSRVSLIHTKLSRQLRQHIYFLTPQNQHKEKGKQRADQDGHQKPSKSTSAPPLISKHTNQHSEQQPPKHEKDHRFHFTLLLFLPPCHQRDVCFY